MAKTKYGIVLISFEEGTTEARQDQLISAIYHNNQDAISGMTYFATDCQSLRDEIKATCTKEAGY